jgi:hypothetical protein
LTKEYELYRNALRWNPDNVSEQDAFIHDLKIRVYYKPEYDGDTPIEQPFHFNFHEILDIFSVKLLVFDYAE